MKRITWINLILGIWLLVSPFAMGLVSFAGAPMANDIILGILLIASSWWILAAMAPPVGLGWFQILCGLWLIVSPFVLVYRAMPGATGNDVVVGIITAIVGIVESAAMARAPRTLA